MSFFEPSPILLAFIFVQRFVYFEVLGLLALLRLFAGRGAARLPALIVAAICCAAVFVTFAPALNLQSVPGYAQVASVMAMGGGIVLPLATSAVFATSMMIRARRWRWIDWVHLIGVLGFAGLWVTTRF